VDIAIAMSAPGLIVNDGFPDDSAGAGVIEARNRGHSSMALARVLSRKGR
jgi:hypothetical protein